MMAKHRTESLTSPRRINAVEKQRRAVELRLAGRTFQEIADVLGYSNHNCANEAVKAALRKTLDEPCAEFRQLTLERLTKILQTHWPNMLRGDVPASKISLQTIGDIRQLMGVDMPARVEHSGPDGNPIRHEVVTIDIGDITEALRTLQDAGAIRMESNGHHPPALDAVHTP